jgi:hypothetical protein
MGATTSIAKITSSVQNTGLPETERDAIRRRRDLRDAGHEDHAGIKDRQRRHESEESKYRLGHDSSLPPAAGCRQ